MIWFARDMGEGSLMFQAPAEGLSSGDQLHLIDGPYSGGYTICQIIVLNPEQEGSANYRLELEPLDEETARKHWGRGGDVFRVPTIAISPPLEVLYADQKV